jgi:hypothetical protein
MRTLITVLSISAISAAAGLATVPANAAPAGSSTALVEPGSAKAFTQVRSRGGWRGGHRGHRGFRTGAAIGLGIAGAAIATGAARGYYYGDDDDYYYAEPVYSYGYTYSGGGGAERCAATFRSFEWDTGLYTTYQGERVRCPYL